MAPDRDRLLWRVFGLTVGVVPVPLTRHSMPFIRRVIVGESAAWSTAIYTRNKD